MNQLLTIARLEPSDRPAKADEGDLVETVRDSLAQMTPWLLSKGLELVFDCEKAHIRTRSDFPAIGIALQNLVTNAVNFSPVAGQVTVSLREDEDCFVISVSDQGPGIDEAQRERLFERFYSRDNDQGVGLGLNIVHMIATRLGGTIQLENEPPQGTRANLALPRSGPPSPRQAVTPPLNKR